MSDHSAILRGKAEIARGLHEWVRDEHAARYPDAIVTTRKEADALTLAADVLDAIPDKDDPVGWVRNAINDQADAQMVYGAVAEVYCNLTNGRLSKPNTAPAAIIAEVEQFINEDIAEALKEAAEEADEDLRALRDAIPGDDKLATVQWAVKIAAELMDEWEEGSTHADTYYIVEHWWRACPPSVRAALRSNGVES